MYSRPSSLQAIERSQHDAKDQMRQQNGQRRLHTVVKCHEARRLEQAPCFRAVLLARHARMQTWEQSRHQYQYRDPMDQAEDCPAPPSGDAQFLKEQHVDEGKYPSSKEVNGKTVEFCPVAIKCKNRAQHVRQIHSREAKTLGR